MKTKKTPFKPSSPSQTEEQDSTVGKVTRRQYIIVHLGDGHYQLYGPYAPTKHNYLHKTAEQGKQSKKKLIFDSRTDSRPININKEKP